MEQQIGDVYKQQLAEVSTIDLAIHSVIESREQIAFEFLQEIKVTTT